MKNDNDFGELRELLHRKPNSHRWHQVLELLHTLSLSDAARFRHEWLPYASAQLDLRWPRAMRQLDFRHSDLFFGTPSRHVLLPLITQGLKVRDLLRLDRMLEGAPEGMILDRCVMRARPEEVSVARFERAARRFETPMPLRRIDFQDLGDQDRVLELLGETSQPLLEGLRFSGHVAAKRMQGILGRADHRAQLRELRLILTDSDQGVIELLGAYAWPQLTKLTLTLGGELAAYEPLFKASWWEQCREVTLKVDVGASAEGEALLRELFTRWAPKRLERLHVRGRGVDAVAEEIAAFINSSNALQEFSLPISTPERALGFLDALRPGEALERAHLASSDLSDAQVVSATQLSHLAQLELDIGSARQRRLARWIRHPERHATIALHGDDDVEEELATLERLPVWQHCAQLVIAGGEVGEEALEELLESPPPRLRHVALNQVDLSFERWQELVTRADDGVKLEVIPHWETRLVHETLMAWREAVRETPSMRCVAPEHLPERELFWLLDQPEFMNEIENLSIDSALSASGLDQLAMRIERGALPKLRVLRLRERDAYGLSQALALDALLRERHITWSTRGYTRGKLSWLSGQDPVLPLSPEEFMDTDVWSALIGAPTPRGPRQLHELRGFTPWHRRQEAPFVISQAWLEQVGRAAPGVRQVRFERGWRFDNLDACVDTLCDREVFPDLLMFIYEGEELTEERIARLLKRLESSELVDLDLRCADFARWWSQRRAWRDAQRERLAARRAQREGR